MSEIRVENIIGETGVDAVQFTKGINATGTLTSTNVSVASSVTAGTLFGNGAGVTNASGGILLRKSAYTISRQSITNNEFPRDDTIPQISEGTQFFSQAYTPSTANCDLYIFCTAKIAESSNVADQNGMALFINDSNDALRVVSDYASGGYSSGGLSHGSYLTLYHKMPSWGASAKTFSLRASGTNAINYQAKYNSYPVQKYSAAASETLFIIEEIAT